MANSDEESRPLLSGSSTTAGDGSSLTNVTSRASRRSETQPDRSRLEDDLLPEDSVLGRNLGWSSAYIIAISRIIGSGIFAVPGVILKSVGSVGMSLTLWVLGAVVAACGLAVGLEYGSMLPRSGGEKVYLEFTYPRPRFLASTLVATQAVLLGFTASNCIVFSQYVHWALDLDPTDFSKKALAVGLMIVITVIHGVWYKAGIRIQNFLGWVKVGLVFFMVLAALYVVSFGPRQPDAGEEQKVLRGHSASAWEGLWDNTDWSFGTLATSLFKVFYSYAGLQNLNNVLNEVRDPVRTLKSVSITALVTACLLYLLTNIAFFAVVPIEQIRESGQLVAALFFERTFGENVGKRILPLAVALSAAGNVMVVTFSTVSNGSFFLPIQEISIAIRGTGARFARD
jgi:amino acid transporter